jgi:transcriptional accessory protein Tex/SPT6
VKDPRKTVKAGDIVKVMEVDADRKRIALSMRMSDGLGEKKQGGGERGGAKRAQNYHFHTYIITTEEAFVDLPSGDATVTTSTK